MPLSQYKFSGFVLDARERTIRKDGEAVKLKNRAFEVLLVLVENAGKIVTKEDFFESIWQDSFVEENNLTVAVAQIRKVLGETRKDKFVETVPKKGYRFVAEVEEFSGETEETEEVFQEDFFPFEDENDSAAEEDRPPETVRPFAAEKKGFFGNVGSRKILAAVAFVSVIFAVGAIWRMGFFSAEKPESFESIAVLPFATERNSPDNEIFAEKLTRELIFNLGHITDTPLSGFEAVAIYGSPDVDLAKAGADLQVDAIVTGRIKSDGGADELEIKINDLRSGEVVFAKNYSLKAQDLPASQHRIALDIAREIGENVQNADQSRTQNLEAYQAYLLARYQLGKNTGKDDEKAIENFTVAVLKDESFADARSGLATAHIQNGLSLYANRGLAASQKSFPAAKENALKALELKSDSDEAFAALAFVNYRYEYDWKTAEANFRKALEINPNNVLARRWFGEFLHKLGRFDEGFAEQQKALALSPNSWRILSEIAWGNYLAGRFDEAEKYSKKSLFIDRRHAATLYNLSEIYEQKGDLAEAVGLWKEAMEIEVANKRWIANIEKSFEKDGQLGFARAKTEWLEDLVEKDYVYPTDLAKSYAVFGEKDKAIKWLEKGIERRVPDILSVKYAPAFDSIKMDARFQAILTKMNFPK